MARLRGQVEAADALLTPSLLQDKVSATAEAMRAAGAPETDIEEFIRLA